MGSAIGLWSIFTARRYAKHGSAVVVCLSVRLFVCVFVCVCVSVTQLYCIKTAKRTITQIMPHDRPRTQVFFKMGCFCSCRISTDKRVARPSAIAEPLIEFSR